MEPPEQARSRECTRRAHTGNSSRSSSTRGNTHRARTASTLALMMLLLLLPLCAWAAPALPKSGRTLRLGFLGSTNLPNSNTQQGGAPALFAARLAVQQINAQAQLLPNITLQLIHNNTNSDPGTGNFLAFDQIINKDVVGIIGEYNSGVSVTVAYPSRFYQIPQMSYGSTSPDFTTFHNAQFPYFMRMCPSQNLESILMVYLIRSLGWQRVGLIYTTDTAGSSGAAVFEAIGTELGVQTVARASFALGAPIADIYFALAGMKATGTTILAFIGAITDMQSVIKVLTLGNTNTGAPPLGMWGKGYQWIGLHSYMSATLFTAADNTIVPWLYEFAQGVIGLQNLADTNSSWFQSYAAAWAAEPPQPDLPKLVPSDPSSMTMPGNFAYDIVWFYARAIDRMQREFGLDLEGYMSDSATKSLFLEVLKNVSFVGVTGPISVDRNGDRIAPFDILNFQGTSVVNVGTVTATGRTTYFPGVTMQFMGGSKAQDHLVRDLRAISVSVRVGMFACTCVCLGIVALGMLALWALRKEAVFKAASPPFVGSMLLGVMLLLTSIFPRAYENHNGGTIAGCTADLFLTNYGYTLIVGSLLLKTVRVERIFLSRRFQQRVLTNWHLWFGLLILLIIQTAILLGLVLGNPLQLSLASFDDNDDYIYCDSTRGNTEYTAAIYSFRFALLAVTAIYSYRIRDIPDDFNESKQLAASVYNLLFLSILLPIIDTAMGRGRDPAVVAYGSAVFVIALVTTLIMLLPKFALHVSLVLRKAQSQGKNANYTATMEGATIAGDSEGSHMPLGALGATGAPMGGATGPPSPQSPQLVGGRPGGSGGSGGSGAQARMMMKPLPGGNNSSGGARGATSPHRGSLQQGSPMPRTAVPHRAGAGATRPSVVLQTSPLQNPSAQAALQGSGQSEGQQPSAVAVAPQVSGVGSHHSSHSGSHSGGGGVGVGGGSQPSGPNSANTSSLGAPAAAATGTGDSPDGTTTAPAAASVKSVLPPRVHVGAGVSNQLMQLLATELSEPVAASPSVTVPATPSQMQPSPPPPPPPALDVAAAASPADVSVTIAPETQQQ